MWIALFTLGVAVFELVSLRFGTDTRETGDWHRVELNRSQS